MALVRVRPARPPVKAARKPRHSPSPRPRQLPTAARSAQPSEPIFFPKLQIHFADFPYLHASSGREAVHLGDLLRIWVRFGVKINLSPGFSRARRSAPDTAKPRCFTGTTSVSPREAIPRNSSLTKKRELFPGLLPASPGSFALPH